MKKYEIAADKRHTKNAVELIEQTLSKYNVDNGCIQLIKDVIYIAPLPQTCQTEELKRELCNVLFWTDTMEVDDIYAYVFYDAENNSVLINFHHYEEIAGVREVLMSRKSTPTRLAMKLNEFCFDFDIGPKGPLQYIDLEKIRAIVDPKGLDSRSAIVFSYKGDYNIRLRV